jgi:hypothetical protein
MAQRMESYRNVGHTGGIIFRKLPFTGIASYRRSRGEAGRDFYNTIGTYETSSRRSALSAIEGSADQGDDTPARQRSGLKRGRCHSLRSPPAGTPRNRHRVASLIPASRKPIVIIISGPMTIDSSRCPTCDGAQFVVLRGDRVRCPTCTPPTHRGDSERHSLGRGRWPTRKLVGSGAQTRRLAVLFFGATALAGVIALLTGASQIPDLLSSWFASKK